MRTVELFRDFDYRLHPRRMVRFQGGVIYARVLEAAAQAIEHNGAGRIIAPDAAGTYSTRDLTDASHAFRPRKR
jgi:hypothetical protein